MIFEGTKKSIFFGLGLTRAGKTYPDIVSVVKMSDLYDISLDRLLKEDRSMPDYLDYLEESTNVVKSKKSLSKLILIATYLVIWAIALIVSAIIFGIMYMLAEYATFSAANMASFDNFNMPELGMLFAGAVISLAGLAIGAGIHRVKATKNR